MTRVSVCVCLSYLAGRGHPGRQGLPGAHCALGATWGLPPGWGCTRSPRPAHRHRVLRALRRPSPRGAWRHPAPIAGCWARGSGGRRRARGCAKPRGWRDRGLQPEQQQQLPALLEGLGAPAALEGWAPDAAAAAAAALGDLGRAEETEAQPRAIRLHPPRAGAGGRRSAPGGRGWWCVWGTCHHHGRGPDLVGFSPGGPWGQPASFSFSVSFPRLQGPGPAAQFPPGTLPVCWYPLCSVKGFSQHRGWGRFHSPLPPSFSCTLDLTGCVPPCGHT